MGFLEYQAYFFDLDGTITDSGPGIMKSVAYALKTFGITEDREEMLRQFVGPPLLDSFQKLYGWTREQALLGVKAYREYYEAEGIWDNVVYEGIAALLKKMKKRGDTVVLATSKPEIYAKRIVGHFGLAEHFDLVAGSTLGTERTQKDQVIAYALHQLSLEGGKVLMIGDRKYDVLGAKQHGMPCLGVLYGYGSREELMQAGAVDIVENVEALGRYLETL